MNNNCFKRHPVAFSIAAMCSLVSVSAVAAPGAPIAPAFAVMDSASPVQQNSSIARDAQGDFVVVWADTGTREIFGRRFAPDASPLDDGFQISVGANNSRPDVAMAPDGRFVVSWLQRSAGHPHVVARPYSADGAPASDRIAVEAETSTLDSGAPAVAIDNDGDFVIGWERNRITFVRDGSTGYSTNLVELGNRSVIAQRFAADGTRRGAAVTAASRPTVIVELFTLVRLWLAIESSTEIAIGTAVDVAMNAQDDFVLVWGTRFSPAGISPNSSNIYARRYGANNAALEATPIVVENAQRFVGGRRPIQSAPTVAMSPTGAFTVAWSQNDPQPIRGPFSSSASVFVRNYDASGRQLGTAVTVDSLISGNVPVAVAANASGGFSLAWQVNSESNRFVRSRLFSANGTPLAPAFDSVPVRADANSILQPAMAASASGGYIVTWTDNFILRNDDGSVASVNSQIDAQTFNGP